MIDSNSVNGDPGDNFLELVVRYLDGELTEVERGQFNTLLAKDPGNCDILGDICTQAFLLPSLANLDPEADAIPSTDAWDGPPGIPDAAWTGIAGWGWPTGLWPCLSSYAIAALMVCLGLFTAWAWRASETAQPLAANAINASHSPGSGPETAIVGRVTKLVDCRWADAGTACALGSVVPLRRKFALASGQLEISYDTGERVLLRGPATYESRWPNGGFLSRGKATVHAPIDKGMEAARSERLGKQYRDEAARVAASLPPTGRRVVADPSLDRAIPGFLFFVRTPSALVMSRNARFDVAVDDSGASSTRLARGTIEAWYSDGGKPNDVISSSAPSTWTWVGFTPQRDVRVMYGTGKAPELLDTALAGSRGRPWSSSTAGGAPLRIWGLQSALPQASAENSPHGNAAEPGNNSNPSQQREREGS